MPIALVLVLISVVAAGASIGIWWLGRYEQSYRARLVELTHVQGEARELHAASFEALIETPRQQFGGGQTPRDSLTRVRQIIDDPARLTTDDSHARAVTEGQADYFATLDRLGQLLRNGKFTLARTVLEGDAEASYEALTASIEDADTAYHDAVSRAESVASGGSIAIIIVSAALISAMVIGLDRTRQRAAILHEESELLRASEARFRPLVQNSSDIIMVLGRDRRIDYQSPSVERVLGYAPNDLDGVPLAGLVHPDDLGPLLALLRPPGGEDSPGSIEARLARAGGDWCWCEIVASDRGDDPNVRGWVLNVRNVGERLELEEQIRYQAFHDTLTGLWSRTKFMELLEERRAMLGRSGGTLAVLFLDLDAFKPVNDTLGHAAGDELLVAVSRRLSASLPEARAIARLGGDEFVIMLDAERGGDAMQRFEAAAELVRHVLSQPVEVSGRQVSVGASIGIAVSGHAESADELVRAADLAMYAAKQAGGGCYRVHDALRGEVVLRLPRDDERAVA